MLKIKVENSFLGADSINMKSEDGRILWKTTKAEKEQHGIGLRNVRKIVELYDGIMETKVHDNIFCVNLVLYMTKIKNEA